MMQLVLLFSSEPGNLLAIAAIGACAGIFWFYKGFRLLQRKRLILNTPTSKVRSASMGLVEISGLAIGPYVVISPLKECECYYYRSIAWELKQQGKGNKWVKVAEEVLHVPFYVDDNTGRMLIDPRGAEMDLHSDFRAQYHPSFFGATEVPMRVSAFLSRHGISPEKKIKVEEYCIKPKNFLFVLGTISQNPGLDASIRPSWAEKPGQRPSAGTSIATLTTEKGNRNSIGSSSTEIIRLSDEVPVLAVTEMSQQQKIAAALMKAGVSNPAAWAAAGIGMKPKATPEDIDQQPAFECAQHVTVAKPVEAIRRTSMSTNLAAAPSDDELSPDTAGFDLHPPVVLMQGGHNPAFSISWQSLRDVVNSLSWKSGLMIWGGPAITVISTYFLLARFGWL
jgi:hypothetical protein